MPILIIGSILAVALLARRFLPASWSSILGRALYWACNGLTALLGLGIAAIAVHEISHGGVAIVFLLIYAGLGATLLLFGRALRAILVGRDSEAQPLHQR